MQTKKYFGVSGGWEVLPIETSDQPPKGPVAVLLESVVTFIRTCFRSPFVFENLKARGSE